MEYDILIIIPNVNFTLLSFDRGSLRLKVRDSLDCTPETKSKLRTYNMYNVYSCSN